MTVIATQLSDGAMEPCAFKNILKNILIGLTLVYQPRICANLTKNTGDRKCKASFRLRVRRDFRVQEKHL